MAAVIPYAARGAYPVAGYAAPNAAKIWRDGIEIRKNSRESIIWWTKTGSSNRIWSRNSCWLYASNEKIWYTQEAAWVFLANIAIFLDSPTSARLIGTFVG